MYHSASHHVVPRPAASAPLGNWLEMQILRHYPRLTASETLGVGPSNLCFNNSSSGDFDALQFENH